MTLLSIIFSWFDNESITKNTSDAIDWPRVIPFILMHLGCLVVFFVGWSMTAIITALFLFWGRLFAIGAFYHRFFSHRSFKTNRFFQFIFAVLGMTSCQRGPIWWAAHHRQHHKVADTEQDPHSPITKSLWTSHMGWFMTKKYFHYNKERVKDLLEYPEIRWLDRFDVVVPLILLATLFTLGTLLSVFFPSLHTSGLQLVVWGFFISTTAVFHSTVSINSLGHKFGSRRYNNKDHSRNNIWLALLTLGEGWHNNHHRYPGTAKQGFKWWEIDITYYILKALEKMKVIHNLRGVPKKIIEEHD